MPEGGCRGRPDANFPENREIFRLARQRLSVTQENCFFVNKLSAFFGVPGSRIFEPYIRFGSGLAAEFAGMSAHYHFSH